MTQRSSPIPLQWKLTKMTGFPCKSTMDIASEVCAQAADLEGADSDSAHRGGCYAQMCALPDCCSATRMHARL